MPTIVLLATLDTKGEESAFLRDRLTAAGLEVIVVDAGVLEPPAFDPDISRATVAQAGGSDHAALAADRDRGSAVAVMARGAAAIVS
jgi:uncharacterized protein (UPF0261 family)